jgi:Pectate lyase superfamily protein
MRPPTNLYAIRLAVALMGASLMADAPAHAAARDACAPAPASSLVVNVKDKGAKGDGKTDDTAAIQAAIDLVAGTGGTVLVPDGIYMIDAAGKPRLSLKDDMTLKLVNGATLKAIPNSQKKYSILTISGVANVAVIGGTLEGERDQHKGKGGEWGMGINIEHGAEHITIAGVTAKKMWGDGFYVRSGSDVTFCRVTADSNRRQGMSIISADGLVVMNSVFKNTRGTRPGAGIDFEPNDGDQTITNVRIENSKFIDNAGPGILIAGKKGAVAKVELTRNMFKGNRPILVENAPQVLASSICGNRQVTPEAQPADGLNAFADPIEVMVHQNACQDGADMRFEVTRQTKKKHK